MSVIKTTSEDRGYKDCLCCVCHTVQQCTPDNDFYSTPEHNDKLVCESCFEAYLADRSITMIR